ncbi:MAG TPA: GNAT family N-acetyltransferase [Streptosporangiaceae bacterium]
MSDATQVTDNAAAQRLEIAQDGQRALLSYRLNGRRLVLIHTEVPEALGGHGVGGRLVRAAIDRAGREGLTVVPLCPFARGWLERHPDVAAQVSIDWGAAGPPGASQDAR